MRNHLLIGIWVFTALTQATAQTTVQAAETHGSHAHAQHTPALSPIPVDTSWEALAPELVVTATRSERQLNQVTVPTLLVGHKEIRLSGNVRLNEVLQEQTGLFLTGGAGSGAVGGGIFGNGIQIQGLSPDYTLILLDGEPMIGRQGGVIDLSRFTVGNIRKIEVIKGPSSALYGSEAMGGVVNILTEQRDDNLIQAGLRYGQFGATDASLSLNRRTGDRSSLYIFGNFNASRGYDLDPGTPEKTLDPFNSLSAQIKWTRRFSERTRLVWNNRLFSGRQQSFFAINSPDINVGGAGRTADLNVNPTLTHWVNDRLKTALRLYGSYYRYDQNLDFLKGAAGRESYYRDDFQHLFVRLEQQTDWDWGKGKQLVAGAAYNLQAIETMRYRGVKMQHIGYAFVQNEWRINSAWTVVPGLRYDMHSDYANCLTPKLSAQYRATPRLNINASYGSGFKAPDFRQLYLYYVNPAAQGYRVYGASEFSLLELERQQREGLVARILPEAYQITALRPESSQGFNLGGNYAFQRVPLKAEINLFYNAVRDMINYLPVAIQSNNSLIFSYMNVRDAFTSGLECNLHGAIGKRLTWSVGYQYLKSGDQDIMRRFREGEVYGRNTPTGSTRRMRRAEYTGLMGRSPHMYNLKLLYEDPRSGWGGSIRAIGRSRWGVTDLDGNGFANMAEEFAAGFVILNLSAQKTIGKRWVVQLNAFNALNHTDPINLPQMPGLNFMAALQWNFSN